MHGIKQYSDFRIYNFLPELCMLKLLNLQIVEYMEPKFVPTTRKAETVPLTGLSG